MDNGNWEEWWVPNSRFLNQQKSATVDDAINDEFYSYIISPDCSSCELAQNVELNDWYHFKDHSNGTALRTAYHMTSTVCGCQGKTKPMKDLRWDYDSYECPFGGRRLDGHYIEDGDLQYTVVLKSENESRWDYFFNLENTASVSIMGLCGVYPYTVHTAQMVTTRDQCNDFTDAVRGYVVRVQVVQCSIGCPV